MYFIIGQDPNYTIKGSRDPLGFQVIWQNAGRKLIPYLSTVSNNIIDFQVLCLAFAVKKIINIPEDEFEAFFIRFEQMFAYTRYEKDRGKGFNGVDKVRKVRSNVGKEVQISNRTEHQILSNQRAYGIWGKYIRPFSDMLIPEDPDFFLIFDKKAEDCKELIQLCNSLKKKVSDVAHVNIAKLEALYSLIEKPTGAEKKFFIKYLLKDNFNNELLNLLTTSVLKRDVRFYELLNTLNHHSDNPFFRNTLLYIKNIELTLSPLNHIFRYLQTHSFWSYDNLDGDDNIKAWRSKINTDGFDNSYLHLASLHIANNRTLVEELCKLNFDVTASRHSAAWLELTTTGVEVNHFEGGFLSDGYDPITDCDNTYFLSSYISLFNQLH